MRSVYDKCLEGFLDVREISERIFGCDRLNWQHKMEKFLSEVVQGKTSVWTAKFSCSTIDLTLFGKECLEVRVDLGKYPWDVRKDSIQQLRLADISSLAMKCITVEDYNFESSFWWEDSAELLDAHSTLTEDIAEIIKALQSTPTTEESSNVIDEVESSQNGQAECNLMEATVSSTHQTQLNHRTLTDIQIWGNPPPQKIKAVCSLIAAPGSTVKLVTVVPYSNSSYSGCRPPLLCRVLEEMLSAQTAGSCPALESLIFDARLVWNGTSVEHLGKFLQRTPSIKEIVFKFSSIAFQHNRLEGSLAEKLAEALCLNNQVHHLHIARPYMDLTEAVMRVLIRDSQEQHPITALSCLHLEIVKLVGFWEESLLFDVIRKTKCLNALKITTSGRALPLKVLEALRFNQGLEHFTWVGDRDVDPHEDSIFSTIMDTLRVNYYLKDFVYPWRNDYYAQALKLLFMERAINKPWEVMKDMVLVPSTSARLFFCGYPYAGVFL